MGPALPKADLRLSYTNLIHTINYFFVLLNCFLALTSVSGMCIHCLGLSSVAKKEISSKAVRRVCRLDETNTSTGLVGECVLIALKVGLFIVAMRGQ